MPARVARVPRPRPAVVIAIIVIGIVASLVAYPPRTTHWEASTTLRVGPAPADAASLESYRLTVLASQVVLRTSAELVQSPATVRRAASSVGVFPAALDHTSVLVSAAPGDLVLTITVQAPNPQTAARLAVGLRDVGAGYLNSLGNTYAVSASGGAVRAQAVTTWDRGRINRLVLFWDVVILLVVWWYWRQRRRELTGRALAP
ncbi:MAG TPA: hypothetical protein VEP49_09705 [Acidimicrobiia bacterium]|nr:hypothetical protein [Acidimicrobiia bacterium]